MLQPDKILIEDKRANKKRSYNTIKNAMIARGIKYKCSSCFIENWQNNKIKLKIYHHNGHDYDNRPFNISFVCPNCYSNLPTIFNRLSAIEQIQQIEDRNILRNLTKTAKELDKNETNTKNSK